MTGARRGRPSLAAKSLDEALQHVYAGTAPRRPRNQLEREAQRRQAGRKPDPSCRTRQAAEAAHYQVKAAGLTAAAAARWAAESFGVNVSNVRRYMRAQVGITPMVSLRYKGAAPYPVAPTTAPLLVAVEDVET